MLGMFRPVVVLPARNAVDPDLSRRPRRGSAGCPAGGQVAKLAAVRSGWGYAMEHRRARSQPYTDGAMIELLELVAVPEFEAASITVEATRFSACAVTIAVSIDNHEEGADA